MRDRSGRGGSSQFVSGDNGVTVVKMVARRDLIEGFKTFWWILWCCYHLMRGYGGTIREM